MTTAQKTILSFLGVMACVLLAMVGYYGVQAYDYVADEPLGAPLPTSLYTPLGLPATWTASPASLPVLQPIFTGPQLPASTPTPVVRCGGPPVMTLLAIGSDTRGSSYNYGLADVIRIVRVDFITPRLTVLEIPRDLWVEIPEIEDNIGQDHEKLNQAYLYGNPGDGFGYWDDPSAGPGLLARTLDLNFGIKADHYVAVNMKTFVRMVDAVDGIDVTLPRTVDGRTEDNNSKSLIYAAGTHHLDGTRALALARVRTSGVFERADNQNLVLCALRKKLTEPSIVTRIPQLIDSFQGSIQTDLSPAAISQLACLGTQLPPENISFASFPEELFTGTRVYDPVFKKKLFIWDADFNILREYVAQFTAGIWPAGRALTTQSDQSTSFCP
jgi:LCP family protein required for cell wall assembly